jgi:hypothetical protein
MAKDRASRLGFRANGAGEARTRPPDVRLRLPDGSHIPVRTLAVIDSLRRRR